ncbi:hypothetical protein HanHA89_Chr01g0038621 [Helianthus annuus]|nr:hypothetical protein HanHA89_Chr01g0038621 [Helianthus annuus]
MRKLSNLQWMAIELLAIGSLEQPQVRLKDAEKDLVTISSLIPGSQLKSTLGVSSALHAGSLTTFLSPPSSPRAGERSPFLESEELESGKGKKEVEAKLVSYSYTFFHLILHLRACIRHAFIGMEQFRSSDLIDVG